MISASIFPMNGRGCKKKHNSLVSLNDALDRYIKFKKRFLFYKFLRVLIGKKIYNNTECML